MSVKFSNPGTIICNSVKYNYKQVRNMIADSTGDQLSGCWTLNGNVESANSSNPESYKSYRCWWINNDASISQDLPTLHANNIYYVSMMINTNASYITRISNPGLARSIDIDLRGTSGWERISFMLEYTLNDNSLSFKAFTYIPGSSTPQSYRFGSIAFANGVTVLDESQFSFSLINEIPATAIGVPLVVTRFIMINLAETSITNMSMDKDTLNWLDNNILENEKYVNWGTISNGITNSNYSSLPSTSNLDNFFSYPYLQLDSIWEPRDYMYMARTDLSVEEGYIHIDSPWDLDNTKNYYLSYYYLTQNNIIPTVDAYWPESEPRLGNRRMILYNPKEYNAGGGMSEWRLVSFYGDRTSFENGEYVPRLDINNENIQFDLRLTNINCCSLQDGMLSEYNEYNNCNITINDINKQWCDRWIAGRGLPIIHIKDSNNTKITMHPIYKKVNRPDDYFYTRAALNSFIRKYDTWGTDGWDNSHINIGDIVYFEGYISDENNKKMRFFVYVSQVTATNISGRNLNYYDETQENYQIPVDIVCNDIEIRPEQNEIKFNYETGTIICSKLDLITERTDYEMPFYEPLIYIDDKGVRKEVEVGWADIGLNKDNLGIDTLYSPSYKTIYLPFYTVSIGDYTFQGFSNATNIELSPKIRTIGQNAFYNCTSLQSVIFPDELEVIGDRAYSECQNLTEVSFGNNITKIGYKVFTSSAPWFNTLIDTLGIATSRDGSTKYLIQAPFLITNMDLNGVKVISGGSFSRCAMLQSITIAESVINIGDRAFEYCGALNSVTMMSQVPPALGVDVFSGTSSALKIYVPQISIDTYKTAENWSVYADRIIGY